MAQEKKKNNKASKKNEIIPVKNSTKKITTSKKKNISKKDEKPIKKEEINTIEKNDELDIVKVDLSSEKKEEYYDILEHEKSHFFIKLLIFILILALGMFIIYKFVIRDQKAIFTSGITTIYEKLANNIVKISNIDILKDNIEIDGVLSVNTTDKNHNDLNNYLYDVTFGINKADKKYKLNVNLKEDDKTITSFNYYYINDNFYLNLGDNYEKTLLLKNNILDIDPSIISYTNVNYNKLNNSAKSIKNIINSNIDRNKLNKGEETINNDKYEYVEMNLSKEDYSNLVSNIIDNIKNNNNLLNTLAEAFNTNTDIVINKLEELQKNNLKNNFNNIKFKFYTHGFMANIVGFEITIDDNQIFYYFNHDNKKDNNCDNCINQIYKLIINYKNYNLYIDKINNTYNCVIKKDDNDYLHLVFNEYSDKTIDINYENSEKNTHGNIHYDSFDKSNDKSGNFKYSSIDNKNTLSLNYDYKIKDNANINLINNYIKVEDLSENDYLTINNNISKSIKNNDIKNKYKDLLEKIYNY